MTDGKVKPLFLEGSTLKQMVEDGLFVGMSREDAQEIVDRLPDISDYKWDEAALSASRILFP